MPIYEYKCRNCGHEFEELVRLGETPDCPSCKGSDLERLVSLPMVSTESTRQRSFDKARQAASVGHREEQHAQREYERKEIKEHGG